MTVTIDQILAAADAVVRNQLATPGVLERELGVGTAVAFQLLTALEEFAVVGPPNGHRSRTILTRIESLDRKLAEIRRAAA